MTLGDWSRELCLTLTLVVSIELIARTTEALVTAGGVEAVHGVVSARRVRLAAALVHVDTLRTCRIEWSALTNVWFVFGARH